VYYISERLKHARAKGVVRNAKKAWEMMGLFGKQLTVGESVRMNLRGIALVRFMFHLA
jgi:hypothetical protein